MLTDRYCHCSDGRQFTVLSRTGSSSAEWLWQKRKADFITHLEFFNALFISPPWTHISSWRHSWEHQRTLRHWLGVHMIAISVLAIFAIAINMLKGGTAFRELLASVVAPVYRYGKAHTTFCLSYLTDSTCQWTFFCYNIFHAVRT